MDRGVTKRSPDPQPLVLQACRRQPVERTPVWFMRQAGRYMAEYRAIRQRHTLLEICAQPALAAEVALQPVNALGVDAAILFADILLPLPPMGLDLEFVKGEGPVIHNPVRTQADVDRLLAFDPRAELTSVMEAIRIVRGELRPEVALIGFSGAPFTVASYMIEGGSSRHFALAKSFMYQEPAAWHRLMERLGAVLADYLVAQVEAGAQVVQLFDSWVGALSVDDYTGFVEPHSRQVIERVRQTGSPLIHFGTGTAALLQAMRRVGGDVIGVDWRLDLDRAWKRIGYDVGIQGNLDPIALMAPDSILTAKVDRILDQAAGRSGHIFNLGHGILPQTDPGKVRAVVERVKAHALNATAQQQA